MKRVLLFLLAVSLATNVWLWRRAPTAVSAAAPVRRTTVAAPPVPPAAEGVALATLESGDAAALRDALRADGADEATVRAVLEGILRGRHRERLAAIRVERTRQGWWRESRAAQANDGALNKELVTDPLEALLGPHPLDVADAESRYAFLPADKQRKLAQIDRDYADMQARRPANLTNAQLKAAADEERLLAEERRKDVVAALTPEEREEYDLRFAGMAGLTSRRAQDMVATEREYRALKPLMDELNRRSQAMPRGENYSREAYEDFQRTAIADVVAALGYDRAMDFLWSGNDYSAWRRAAQAAQLPADTPARIMDLVIDVAREATRIHADPTLTAEQKQAALPGLQQSARARLERLLPPAAQQRLPADGLRWLDALGKGQYVIPQPGLLGTNGFNSIIMTITSSLPPTRADPFAVLPPRPGR